MNIIDVLSKTQSVRLLLRIREMEPCPKKRIIQYSGSSEKTKWERLNDLETAGLVHIDKASRYMNCKMVSLTPVGRKVTDLLAQISELDRPASKGPCCRCRHSWQDDDGLFACTLNCPDRCIRGWHDGMYGCDHFEEVEE